MKLLIIGGTRFVGRAIVEMALAGGHEVTVFNRGRSNAVLFPEVEKLVGDRDGGLDVLKGREWDAVIDSSGYIPRLVRDSAQVLADSVGLYTYVSSISVFSRHDVPAIDENSPVGVLEDEMTEEVNGVTYGPLKALCEREIDRAMNGRALHIRSGLVVGPHDHSDRFTYWAYRVSQGGEVLAPGAPETEIQFIDARDLGNWAIQATAEGLTGPYISTGPAYKLTIETFLLTCKAATQSDATFTWVGDTLLADNGLREEIEIPWWLPEGYYGYGRYNTQKALQAGLRFRPLAESVQETLAWHASRPVDHKWQSGLRPDQEKALLEAWHQNSPSSP